MKKFSLNNEVIFFGIFSFIVKLFFNRFGINFFPNSFSYACLKILKMDDSSETSSVSLTSLLDQFETVRTDSDFSPSPTSIEVFRWSPELIKPEEDKKEKSPTLILVDSSKIGILTRSLKYGGLKKVSFTFV